MNAIRPIAVKLDQDTRDRLKRLADAKDRSTHWMLREAVAQFVERVADGDHVELSLRGVEVLADVGQCDVGHRQREVGDGRDQDERAEDRSGLSGSAIRSVRCRRVVSSFGG